MSILLNALVGITTPLLLACQNPLSAAEPGAKSEPLERLSDEDLERHLDGILSKKRFTYETTYETCLQEIVRRGGKKWEASIRARVQSLMDKEIKPYEKADYTVSGTVYNLELLTALRRIQKKPDPLQIVLETAEPLIVELPSLPRLRVKIQNLDFERKEVGFTIGGDYRTGRQTRWRVVLKNEKGKEMPTRGRLGSFLGGAFSEGTLKYGNSWETTLDVRSYIRVPPPGKYTLQVLYHNTARIAEESAVPKRILSLSKPIRFVVRPLTIALTDTEKRTAKQLISELDGNKPLKVMAGTYGKSFHGFIAPNTAEGKLLSMGIKAAPMLIEVLQVNGTTARKRAWLLSILFSVTGENDPRRGDALGSYKFRETGWQIWGSRSGESPSGGLGLGGSGSVSNAKIDTREQKRLIASWRNWLKRVNVTVGSQSADKAPKKAKGD